LIATVEISARTASASKILEDAGEGRDPLPSLPGDGAGVGAGARAQRAPQLPGHCGLVTSVASADGDYPRSNARVGRLLDAAWPPRPEATRIARCQAWTAVDSRMNGVDPARDPDVSSVPPEDRSKGTPGFQKMPDDRGRTQQAWRRQEARTRRSGPRWCMGQGPLPCEVAWRHAGDACGVVVGGQAQAGGLPRIRCDPHGSPPPPHRCVSRSKKTRTRIQPAW
jgi:hypothetical protein